MGGDSRRVSAGPLFVAPIVVVTSHPRESHGASHNVHLPAGVGVGCAPWEGCGCGIPVGLRGGNCRLRLRGAARWAEVI